jgi:DNA-binding response OmpR family regulator
MELLARLEAIARRKPQPRQPEVIEMGALRVNCQTRCAQRDGALVDLSAKDFDLLVLFLRNVGRLPRARRFARRCGVPGRLSARARSTPT